MAERRPDDHELERALGGAWSAPAPLPPSREPREAISEAMGVWRAGRRRRRLAAGGVAALLVAGVVALVAWPGTSAPKRPGPDGDPVAYARDLQRRALAGPRTKEHVYPYLSQHPEAQREYMAALEHPSSAVRRSALYCLCAGQIDVDPQIVLRMLKEHREDLETPLQLAGIDSPEAAVAEAIERRRTATLQRVLSTVAQEARQGRSAVTPDDLMPLLRHANHNIRISALRALLPMEGVDPSGDIVRLMREDPEIDARIAAAELVVAHGGPEGLRQVEERIRSGVGPDEERMLAMVGHGKLPMREFALERLQADIDDRTAVIYTRYLEPNRDREIWEATIRRGLASRDILAVTFAATNITRRNAVRMRTLLLEARRRVPADQRWKITGALLHWDLKSGDRARGLEAVKLSRESPHRSQVGILRSFLDHADAEVRAAVRAALDALEGG